MGVLVLGCDFSYKSIGLNIFGADLGHASIIMGEGISRRIETTGGIGIGMGGTILGTSKITGDLYPYTWEDCSCNEN
ncbi:hypothetical protein [Thiolapillus sp.]